MRIRVLAGLAGESITPGQVLDLPPNEARELIAQQRAELLPDEPVIAQQRTTRAIAKK